MLKKLILSLLEMAVPGEIHFHDRWRQATDCVASAAAVTTEIENRKSHQSLIFKLMVTNSRELKLFDF